MDTFAQAVMSWLRQLDFEDHDKNLTALYIQAIALAVIVVAAILGAVYAVVGQVNNVVFIVVNILIQIVVIALIRFKQLRCASNLFLLAALALLSMGILSAGGIHASSVVLYPVILLFASLLLDRRSYTIYALLCITSIGLIVYAENQKLTPPFVPDPPELPLFISVSLIVISAAVIARFITESLQNNILRSRSYASDLANQKAMLDCVGQAVVGCLWDNSIIYWNQAAVELYGWSVEAAIGRKYFEVVPTQLTHEMLEGIWNTLRSGETWSGEFVVQKHDQSPLTVLGTMSVLRDDTGAVTGWIGVAADLSDRVKVQEIDKRRADEMSLLYCLGVSLTSGKTLYETLLALQTEIVKFIQADAFYVAIYNEQTDIVNYPIFFDEGSPVEDTPRRLHERPGLTGAVIFSGKTLYLPNMFDQAVQQNYSPVDDGLILYTFLGIPLVSSGHIIGMLSVQSKQIDAYTADQIQLVENIAVQAAIAIDKANLLDQLKQELGERVLAEAQLHEREAILESITFAAEKFLKSSDWRININQVLERLGKTLNVTHAYLFEDHLNAQGEPVTSMRYEWTADGYPSDLDGLYFQDSKIEQKGFEEQVDALRRGDVRVGNSTTFNPIEKESMAELGVKSILEVPVFVNGREWGAIGFDDFEQEREWNHAEVDVLKIAAGVLSAAIQRQEAEVAVRESERIYRQAIEAAGAVPYYRNYGKNHYEFVGDAIEKMIGYKPEEVTTELWLNIMKENIPLGEGEGLHIDHAVTNSRTGRFKVWRSDIRVAAKNGGMKWITDSAVELFDDSEYSYASVGILQDVTDRKLIEENLRKRESILAAVTFAAEQFLRTPDWRININAVLERLGKEFNASHAYLFEKHLSSDGILLGSLRYEWVAPGQHSDMENPAYQNAPMHDSRFGHYYATLHSGEPYAGGTLYFLESEEEKAWMDTTGIKALLEMRIVVDGRQWGTLGFDEMVNEREWTPMEVDVLRVAANVLGAAIKRQLDEAALQRELEERKRAEENYRSIFNNSIDGIFQSTDDGRFVTVNPAMARIYGYDSPEDMLRTVNNIGSQVYVNAEQRQEVRQRLASGEKLIGYETLEYRKDGSMFWSSMTAQAVMDGNGKVLYYEGTVEDVTPRRRADMEREKLINDLESKNTELERFTYTVSHDLKSPLVTINGFLGYLEQDAASGNMERLKKDTNRIQEAVNKMQRLLNELLELSRIGRMMNAPQITSFDGLVREALEIVQGRLNERHVTVQVQPNLPAIFGDRPRLVEVMQNLLDNAAKYMGDQQNPYVEIGQRGDEHGQPVFYVKDNGMGVAPEYHERIFGLFNKLDAKSEGTGVGLALVKRIIEVHQGRIWIESEPGHGSTFLFTLPSKPEPDSVI